MYHVKSITLLPGTGSALQTAVNSVLFITVKMSSFYLLWTYLTHNLFQVWGGLHSLVEFHQSAFATQSECSHQIYCHCIICIRQLAK